MFGDGYRENSDVPLPLKIIKSTTPSRAPGQEVPRSTVGAWKNAAARARLGAALEQQYESALKSLACSEQQGSRISPSPRENTVPFVSVVMALTARTPVDFDEHNMI